MSDQLNAHRPGLESTEGVSSEKGVDIKKFEKEFREGLEEIDKGMERSEILLGRVREENKRLVEIVKGIEAVAAGK